MGLVTPPRLTLDELRTKAEKAGLTVGQESSTK